jgi:Short C-terminal domain
VAHRAFEGPRLGRQPRHSVSHETPRAAIGKIGDYVRGRINPGPTAETPELASAPPSNDPMAQLKQLGELRDAGVVSQEQFEAKKAELLARPKYLSRVRSIMAPSSTASNPYK